VRAAFAAAFCLALAGACADEETGHPPVARIAVTPAYIPQNDAFQTAIGLDGTHSADEIDDPAAARPLRFQWGIGGAFRLQDGALDAPALTILLAGDRPVPITLAVTDSDDGLAARATVMIGISLPP
jgi:hypothetical protein